MTTDAAHCPDCRTALKPLSRGGKFYYVCTNCSGQAVTLSVIKALGGAEFVSELSTLAKPVASARKRGCPECSQPMAALETPGEDAVLIDACRHCAVLWFDRGELEHLPGVQRRKKAEAAMPQEAREALAMARIETLAADAPSKERRAMFEALGSSYPRSSRVQRAGNAYDEFDALADFFAILGGLFRRP